MDFLGLAGTTPQTYPVPTLNPNFGMLCELGMLAQLRGSLRCDDGVGQRSHQGHIQALVCCVIEAAGRQANESRSRVASAMGVCMTMTFNCLTSGRRSSYVLIRGPWLRGTFSAAVRHSGFCFRTSDAGRQAVTPAPGPVHRNGWDFC